MESESGHRGGKNRFLSIEHLYNICAHDERKLSELLSYALPILRGNVIAIGNALNRRSDADLLRELHQLKGSLGVIEPERLYVDAAFLEEEYNNMPEEEKRVAIEAFIENVADLAKEVETLNSNFKR